MSDHLTGIFAKAAERGQRIRWGCDLHADCYSTLDADESGTDGLRVHHAEGCLSVTADGHLEASQ